MLNFKKPTFWIIIVAVMMIGAVWVGRITNPQTIPLPEVDAVQSIEIEQFSEYASLGLAAVTDIGDIEVVLSSLVGAKKTMRQSTNDYPIQANYLLVRVMLEGERRTLCLYSDGGTDYIEEPYVGIYKSNRAASAAINKIYSESDVMSNEVTNNLSGVTMTVKEETVSPTGLTVEFENTSDNQCIYGDYFLLEKSINGRWYQVPVAIEGSYGFDDIGYELASGDNGERKVEWGWLYGSLVPGEYRIVKDILDFRNAGDYDKYYLGAEFVID